MKVVLCIPFKQGTKFLVESSIPVSVAIWNGISKFLSKYGQSTVMPGPHEDFDEDYIQIIHDDTISQAEMIRAIEKIDFKDGKLVITS